MGIMARIVRIWKADIHGFMDRFEDKDRLLRQYLLEMENCLHQKGTQIQELEEQAKALEADLKNRGHEIGKLEKDLATALRTQKDTIARLLLRRHITQQKQCEHVQHQYQALLDEQKQLSERLEDQCFHYEILKAKADRFLQSRGQKTVHERFGLIDEKPDVWVVNENEIEMELIRRKEQFADNGATA